MGNRLDTELRQITDSISLLKEGHEIASSPNFGGNKGPSPKVQKGKPTTNKENMDSESTLMTLNDPKGFEDRLMARVKDALKGIID